MIAAEVEEVVDPVVGGEERLGLASWREPLHLPLASARRLVRVFRPIVEALVFAMLDARHDLLVRGLITAKFIRDEHTRNVRAAFEQFAEEFLRRRLVPAALDQDVQYVAVLIDRPPEVRGLAVDLETDLIQVPFIAWLGPAPSELVGILLAKLQTPLPNRFIAHEDAPLSQKVFNVAVAQREAVVEPDRVTDN